MEFKLTEMPGLGLRHSFFPRIFNITGSFLASFKESLVIFSKIFRKRRLLSSAKLFNTDFEKEFWKLLIYAKNNKEPSVDP